MIYKYLSTSLFTQNGVNLVSHKNKTNFKFDQIYLYKILLKFISSNKFSMKIWYLINLIITIFYKFYQT